MNLSLGGDIASIMGVVVTAALFWWLRQMKSHYNMLIGRVPELVSELDGCASNLSDCTSNFAGRMPAIEEELGNAETLLESITKNSPREIKKVAIPLLKTIKKYDINGNGAKDQVREIYLDIRKLIGKIKNLQKDLEWEM